MGVVVTTAGLVVVVVSGSGGTVVEGVVGGVVVGDVVGGGTVVGEVVVVGTLITRIVNDTSAERDGDPVSLALTVTGYVPTGPTSDQDTRPSPSTVRPEGPARTT